MYRIFLVGIVIGCWVTWSSCKKDRVEWDGSKVNTDTSIWARPIVPANFFYGGNIPEDSIWFSRVYADDSISIEDTIVWTVLSRDFVSGNFTYQVYSIPNGLTSTLLLGEECWLGVKNNSEPSSLYYKTVGSNMKLVDLTNLDPSRIQKFNSYYILANARVDFSYFSPFYLQTIDSGEYRAFNVEIDSIHANSQFQYSTGLVFTESFGVTSLNFSRVSMISGDTLEVYKLRRIYD